MKVIWCVVILITISLILSNLINCAWADVKGFIYDSKGRRDPFIPLLGKGAEFLFIEEAVESVAGIYLTGVVYDPIGQSFATINGEVVVENDLVGAFKVKEIREGKVILEKDNEEFVVNLIEEAQDVE